MQIITSRTIIKDAGGVLKQKRRETACKSNDHSEKVIETPKKERKTEAIEEKNVAFKKIGSRLIR